MRISDVVFYVLTLALAFFITVAAEKMIIPRLCRVAKQPIYAEGPRWHLSKSGTPTMGGIGFIAATAAVSALSVIRLYLIGEAHHAVSLTLIFGYGALNALIGIIDDIAKIRKKENEGLRPMQKLALQAIAATLFLISRAAVLGEGTEIVFASSVTDLGMLYYPLAMLMLLGTVNCANLTDGVDGISAGVAFSASCALAILFASVSYDVGTAAFALIGSSIGFLCFNVHPAKIFMGDTGSLFLGSVIAAACIALGNPLIIVFIGIVYLIEGISVIVQVAVYKSFGKRVFKMAPIHHHLERCGWSENKIVIFAMMLTFIASLAVRFIFV